MKTTLDCAVCGKTFTSYNPNPQFCSKKCANDWKRADIDPRKVRKLYASGLTQEEVAARLGTTQKVIWRVMQLNGIKVRENYREHDR